VKSGQVNRVMKSGDIMGEKEDMSEVLEQQKKGGDIHNKEYFSLEEVLLVHDFSQRAFINLSKSKGTVRKKDLLDETKRLLLENIMEKIREKKA